MKDLTSRFLKYKSNDNDSLEDDPKARFLIRDNGFMMGGGFSSLKSPDSSIVNDKGALLPTSTKASSNTSESDSEHN